MNAPESLTRLRETSDRQRQLSSYQAVRQATVALAAPLSPEDCQAQSMPDASPAKWHLAHTTWFFETFLLGEFSPDYKPEFPEYRVLFNSYYNAVGDKHPRPHRGLLSRPTLAQVLAYRDRVDDAMAALISGRARRNEDAGNFDALLTLGFNHEQQHQELILTDIKHLLSSNPIGPAYGEHDLPGRMESEVPSEVPSETAAEMLPEARVALDVPAGAGSPSSAPDPAFVRFEGGIVTIGHEGDGFCFDNECPAHPVLLQPFELCERLVTAAEYLAFIDAGGYQRPEYWLSLGWDTAQAGGWRLPIYWRRASGPADPLFEEFTLKGWQPLNLSAPVAHLSFFEADAFARWAGLRLPTEAEWEHAAGQVPVTPSANLLERGLLRPLPASQSAADPAVTPKSVPGERLKQSPETVPGERLKQLWGDLWEWTASPYVPYPGFKTSAGAVGEYNGKFMCNQYVLRGGSFATSRTHIRASYRNFFPPEARWQFTGLRLARDCSPSGAASPKD